VVASCIYLIKYVIRVFICTTVSVVHGLFLYWATYSTGSVTTDVCAFVRDFSKTAGLCAGGNNL